MIFKGAKAGNGSLGINTIVYNVLGALFGEQERHCPPRVRCPQLGSSPNDLSYLVVARIGRRFEELIGIVKVIWTKKFVMDDLALVRFLRKVQSEYDRRFWQNRPEQNGSSRSCDVTCILR